MQLDKQKKILLLIVFSLLVYLDYSYVLKAQLAGISVTGAKIAKLKTDLDGLTRDLDNMRSAKNGALPAADKPSDSAKLIAEGQIPALLQDISVAANRFGIKVTQMRPSRQEKKEKTPAGQEKFETVLIDLEMVGDYHSLGRFIQALEASPVFMEVRGMEISTQLPDYLKQKISLALRTYVIK